jgi:hypothetical protein
MATTIGVFGKSGDGKSTSIVVNPDGTYDPVNYLGMNPKTTVYINADKKKPPFPLGDVWEKGKNYFITSDSEAISTMVKGISEKGLGIKSIIIDTLNGVCLDKEMLESKKLTFDKWMN